MARSLAHIRSNASYDLAKLRSKGGHVASLDGTRYEVCGPAWRSHIKVSVRRQERRFVAVNAVAEDLALDDDDAIDAYEAEQEQLAYESHMRFNGLDLPHEVLLDEWPWWNHVEEKWEF